MEHCMFHASDIHVHRQVLVCFFLGNQFLVIVAVHIPEEIPGGTCPLRHGVGLPFGICAAHRTFTVYPLFDGCKGGFSRTCGFIGCYVRQHKGQFFLGNRNIAAFGAVDDGDGFAPVALSGEHPVTKFVVYRGFSQTPFFNHVWGFLFQHSRLHTVPFPGVDHDAGGLGVSFGHVLNFFSVLGNNLNNGNIKFFGKCEVPVIVGRNTHDGSSAVVSQHVIG